MSQIPHILFVDDEESLAKMNALKLEASGYKVTVAHRAEFAMELLVEQSFDLIISDINMPGASGIEFLELTKLMEHGVPIILISGHISENILKKTALFKGAISSLAKPYRHEDLLNLVHKALSSEQEKTQNKKSIKKILLVEDENELHDMLVQTLQQTLGGQVELSSAKNGLEACELVGKESFDCIVTDLQMPHMNGCEFLDFIHQDGGYTETPVIVITAYTSLKTPPIEDLTVLDKPFSSGKLAQLIAQKLDL